MKIDRSREKKIIRINEIMAKRFDIIKMDKYEEKLGMNGEKL